MPIQGLTEKRRLPRLGKLHLGIKKTKTVNGREVEYPSAVDYFVCPPEVQKIFGEKPKELRILIPVEDEERWASQYYRSYTKTRGLVCKGDGINAVRMVDVETGTLADSKSQKVIMKDTPCQGRECPDYNKQCREVMNLQFLLPEVAGLGIWQIDTGSINSIRNINSASELIKRIYGRISMIPLLLTVEPYSVQDPDGKKRDVYVLNLRTNQTLLELMETARTKRLTTGEGEPMMPEPDDELPELIMPQNQEPVVTEKAMNGESKAPEPKLKAETLAPWEAKTPAPSEKTKTAPPAAETTIDEDWEKMDKETAGKIQNVTELKGLMAKHKVGTREVYEILSIKSFMELVDLDQAWADIKAAKKIE
jgi:hypothetical protein